MIEYQLKKEQKINKIKEDNKNQFKNKVTQRNFSADSAFATEQLNSLKPDEPTFKSWNNTSSNTAQLN